MGSIQSTPCSYKSPKATDIKIVYTKKASQSRANIVPLYGPVGINNCLKPSDRSYENYSMTKHYESLSLAKKSCNLYLDCDMIVEINRSKGLY